MKNHICEDAIIRGVVEHMNDDHSDACLAIVQALGCRPEATKAIMTGMDATGVDFAAMSMDGQETRIHIKFDKQITRDSQIRGHLVALTKRARAALNS